MEPDFFQLQLPLRAEGSRSDANDPLEQRGLPVPRTWLTFTPSIWGEWSIA